VTVSSRPEEVMVFIVSTTGIGIIFRYITQRG
jgi:hypothetical protein